MTNIRLTLLACLLVAMMPLAIVSPVFAQADFTLFNASQSGMASDSTPLLFTVNLSNGALPSTLDGFSATFMEEDAPAISVQPFIDFVSDPSTPDPLSSGYSANGVSFFTVDLSNSVSGTYTGVAHLMYDTDGVTPQFVERSFTVMVAPAITAPESGTGVLYLVGSIGILAVIVIRSRARSNVRC